MVEFGYWVDPKIVSSVYDLDIDPQEKNLILCITKCIDSAFLFTGVERLCTLARISARTFRRIVSSSKNIERVGKGSYKLNIQVSNKIKNPVNISLFNVVLACPNLNASEQLIALTVGNHMSVSGECFPSKSRIVKLTGLSRWTVSRGIGAIIKKGVCLLKGKFFKFITPALTREGNKIFRPKCTIDSDKMHPDKGIKPGQNATHKKSEILEEKIKEKERGEPREGIKGESVKVNDAILKALKGEGKPKKKYSKTNLGILWKEIVTEYNPETGGLIHVTGKEGGQLRYVASLVGYTDMNSFLTFIVKNWKTTSNYVSDLVGIDKVPINPTIWFLTKYATEFLQAFTTRGKEDYTKNIPLSPSKPTETVNEPFDPEAYVNDVLNGDTNG